MYNHALAKVVAEGGKIVAEGGSSGEAEIVRMLETSYCWKQIIHLKSFNETFAPVFICFGPGTEDALQFKRMKWRTKTQQLSSITSCHGN
jgi:hypothetical protein